MNLYVYRCPHCGPGYGVALRADHEYPECAMHRARMVRCAEDQPAVLPLDGPPASLAPLKVGHLKAAGILLPETQDALEWLYRHRGRNGMAGAFLKVGGRRCVDLVAFAKLIREQKA